MRGYAVQQGPDLLLNTVGCTPRSAMVNWLVTEAGYRVSSDDTDEQIREAFLGRHESLDAVLVAVQCKRYLLTEPDPRLVGLV